MMWIESVNAIDLAVRGMVVGIVASAPMGPVGVLTVQRTFNKGRWYGFATGLGAALSDLIYAMLTGLGMSFVMDFIERPTTIFCLKILGSIMLFFFGAYTYFVKPTKPHKSSGKVGSFCKQPAHCLPLPCTLCPLRFRRARPSGRTGNRLCRSIRGCNSLVALLDNRPQ